MNNFNNFSKLASLSSFVLLSGFGQVAGANDPGSPLSSTITAVANSGTTVSPPASHTYTISSDINHTITNLIQINYLLSGSISSTNSFFHLGNFSLAAGDTAKFSTNSSTNDIVWIDNQANIWGKISTENTGASYLPNLYIFDPHGINLYNGSQIDVVGSFFMSNASNVHLGYFTGSNNTKVEDGCYGAGCLNNLTASNPVAFGFLGNETGNLTVHGATLNNFAEDTQVELIGTGIDIANSTISINNGGMQGYDNSTSVLVPYSDGIDIRVLSLASGDIQNIPLNLTNWHEADPVLNTIQFNGSINISNSLLNSGGDGEETIIIKGGNITIDHSTLIATNWGTDTASNTPLDENFSNPLIENNGNNTSDFDDVYPIEPPVPPSYTSIDIHATNKLDITSSSQLLAWSTYQQAGSINLVSPVINIDSSTIDTRAASITWYNQTNNTSLNSIVPGQPISFDPGTGYFSLSTPFQIISDSLPSFQSQSTASPGNINITATGNLTISNNSIINSSSYVNANGGNININAGNYVWLANSQMTTSVNVTDPGLTGGNINLSTTDLVLEGGFIQANSRSVGGNGGLVNINAPYIVPSGGYVLVGGSVAQAFQPNSGMNVIQAAAPDGVNGAINITSPQLNLSGTLATIVIPNFDQVAFTQDMCALGEGSSLTQTGRGALPRRADDKLLWIPSSQ